MSDIKAVVEWLKKTHEDNADAANNKAVKRWSTSEHDSYSALLEEVANADDLSEELAKSITTAIDGSGGRDFAKNNANEISLQVVNAVKGSLRRKFVHSTQDKELASLNFQRYAVNERKEAVLILERLEKWAEQALGGD